MHVCVLCQVLSNISNLNLTRISHKNMFSFSFQNL
uniref:Uncharacterized protein n=1 Tax=Salix viminalis TaxID=40686 RepID=A0A6N2NJS6_SALVM